MDKDIDRAFPKISSHMRDHGKHARRQWVKHLVVHQFFPEIPGISLKAPGRGDEEFMYSAS